MSNQQLKVSHGSVVDKVQSLSDKLGDSAELSPRTNRSAPMSCQIFFRQIRRISRVFGVPGFQEVLASPAESIKKDFLMVFWKSFEKSGVSAGLFTMLSVAEPSRIAGIFGEGLKSLFCTDSYYIFFHI